MAAAAPAAAPAAKSPPKQKSPPKNKSLSSGKKKSVGRPKRSLASRAVTGYKTYATGVTRNSPYTNPNIIFWVGISLIFLAGWSSGRLKNIITGGWTGSNPSLFVSAIKSTAAQLIFLFLLVVLSRAVPAFARVALVLILGFGLLWLIKNPQIVQLLASMSAGGNTNNKPLPRGSAGSF